MEEERSTSSNSELGKKTPEMNTSEEWFKLACYLSSRGKQKEAELAIRNSLNIQDDYPIAWAILSAILLSQGRETDAEQAGKKAISQCKELKMTWPKLRSIIYSHGVIRGSSWKDPRRVVIESNTNTEWSNLLSILGTASEQNLDEISSSQEMLDDKEESQLQASTKQYTPAREIRLTEKKEYELSEKRFQTPSVIKEIHEPVKQQDVLTWLAEAESYLKKGNLDKAEAAFLSALEIDPDRGDAWFRVSSILMGKHKYDEAIASLKNATDTMPKSSEAWYQLGYCYQKLNKWKDAVKPIRNAIKLDQNKPDYWMALGLSEFHLGQIESSARSLLRVLRISPNHKDALFYLAMCMERQGNRKHALSLYLKLLSLEGLDRQMLLRMASSFERLNRPREAQDARRKAEIVRQSIRR